jgi:hypothetical protein
MEDGREQEFTYRDEAGKPFMVPKYDPALEDWVDRHAHDDIHRPDAEKWDIAVVDNLTWQATDVVRHMKTSLEDSHGVMYSERDQLKDDAMKCFGEHHRPKDSCMDVFSESKLIGNHESQRHIPKSERMYLCHLCLDGDTEVITRYGTRTIRDLARDGEADLLVPPKHGVWAGWRSCEVRSFGVDRLYRIDLHRGRATKTVLATATHRWVAGRSFVDTLHLSPGLKLDYAQAPPLYVAGGTVVPSPIGIAHGIVFGDGTRGTGSRPAVVRLYGAKRELLPWFPLNRTVTFDPGDEYSDRMAWEVRDLPRAWKTPPDLTESRSYLLGWLAGYMATDGSVSSAGQATLESARRENLQVVRDVCYLLGVLTHPIQERKRLGKGREVSSLYRVSINAADLPDSFWLRSHHRQRALTQRRVLPREWVVDAVTDTGEDGEVFCAIVPQREQFVLADGLVTGNCPFVHGMVIPSIRHKKGYDR